MIDVEQVYKQHVQALPEADQLRLMGRIADGLARQRSAGLPQRNIMELHGKGAQVWRGVDAVAYVDGLRCEWDDQP